MGEEYQVEKKILYGAKWHNLSLRIKMSFLKFQQLHTLLRQDEQI